jgi:ubiquinone/menaquinone biosynthesis C-methylase UbiE
MSFDTLAPYYRGMEFVTAGGMLQRCRTSFLAETRSCRRALLLGEGPGRFLVELLRSNPRIEIVCVERSPAMIEQAVHQLKRNDLNPSRVKFQQCDALRWQAPREEFDLVATHFFLDCFRRDELEGLIAKIGAAASPEARWLLTDFRVPSSGWQKWRARMALALMYSFFRMATGLSATRLAAVDDLIERAGFRRTGQVAANFGFVRAELWKRGDS